MALVDPLTAVIFAFIFLVALLIKRVSIEITLMASALVLSVLALDFPSIPTVFADTVRSVEVLSLVGASFGIMLLSQLYRETGTVEVLSRSFSRLVGNSKLVISVLPAVIGLLPVAGGALMSAPLMEAEAENLEMQNEKKAYVNIWFRHTIFPVYPISQVLILLSTVTAVSLTNVILRQIPVVLVMVLVGFFLGLWRVPVKGGTSRTEDTVGDGLASLFTSISPIVVMIVFVVAFGFDVFFASLVGLLLLVLIARPSAKALLKVFSDRNVYRIAFAAFGAMFLRNVTMTSGVSQAVGNLISHAYVSEVLLVSIVPAALAFLLGSPYSAIALSVPMLDSAVLFTPQTASLLYIAAYFGYLGAPTHLCFVLTVKYFKTSLSRVYRYLTPSLILSFVAALLVYLLV